MGRGHEDFGVGVFLEPVAEGHDFVFDGDGDGVAFACAADGVEFSVCAGVPHGIGFPIEEEEGLVEGVSADSEFEFLSIVFTAVHDSQINEGSVGDR